MLKVVLLAAIAFLVLLDHVRAEPVTTFRDSMGRETGRAERGRDGATTFFDSSGPQIGGERRSSDRSETRRFCHRGPRTTRSTSAPSRYPRAASLAANHRNVPLLSSRSRLTWSRSARGQGGRLTGMTPVAGPKRSLPKRMDPKRGYYV
jgi:hypothetical protein